MGTSSSSSASDRHDPQPRTFHLLGVTGTVAHGIRNHFGTYLSEAAPGDPAAICAIDPEGELARRLGAAALIELARRRAPVVVALGWGDDVADHLAVDEVIDLRQPLDEIERAILLVSRRTAPPADDGPTTTDHARRNGQVQGRC